MGLVLKFSLVMSQDCLSFSFRDDTGIYNATSNPTGYGGANPATTDMAMASLVMILADGTSQTFTLGFYPLFPNTNGMLFKITNVNLGLAADVPITDWLPYITYHVSENSDGSDGYTTSKYCFVSCQSQCCVDKLNARIEHAGDCNCTNAAREKWSQANALLVSIQNALNCSTPQPNKANVDLQALTELCAQSGCGCGGS